MVGQLTNKVRLVRCPNCHRVLPEWENVPVYQCGGCRTILQAKKRKNVSKDGGSTLNERDIGQKNDLEHVSDKKEAQSSSQDKVLTSTSELPLNSSQKEVLPSTSEQPLDGNYGNNHNEVQDSNREKSGDIKNASELSTELTCHGNEESLPAVRARIEVEEENHSLEQNNGEYQKKDGCCNVKQPGGVSFSVVVASSAELKNHKSEESSSVAEACNGKEQFGDMKSSSELSKELTCHGNEESFQAARVGKEVDEDDCSFKQINGGDLNEYGCRNAKQPEGGSVSPNVALSTELNHHNSEESSPIAAAHSEKDLRQNDGETQSEYKYRNRKLSSSLAEVHEVDENNDGLEQNCDRTQSEPGDHKREWPGNSGSDGFPIATDLTCHEIEDSSPVLGTNTELDENFKSRYRFASLSAEEILAMRSRDPISISQRPVSETILTECNHEEERISVHNHMSAHSDQLEQFPKETLAGFDRVSSLDTLENIALTNPSSEFSATLKDIGKSPVTRSYYAYDGSGSSYDGSDDQVSALHLRSRRRNFKDAESAGAKAMPGKEEVMPNRASSYPDLLNQAWNSSSVSSEKKHYAMKGSEWCQDELPESFRQSRPIRSRMNFEPDERLSRLPFYSRGCQDDCEHGNLSNDGLNEFHRNASFDSPKKLEYPEEQKLELLKMVYELQDQLRRTRVLEGKVNGRFPGFAGKEKQIPPYYDRAAPEVEVCNNLSHPVYPERLNQRRSCPHQSRVSRIPFSAEATNSRRPVDCSYSRICSQDWPSSAPLPANVCFNKGQYSAHRSQSCYSLHSSCPSSPRQYIGSEFSAWSYGTKSNDHWNTNHNKVKIYSKEGPHVVRRHVLPVARGAPFLVCYNCSRVLQLPADFLLFRRKCHQLSCSACLVILKFSLQNGTHIVRYTDFCPDVMPPPPSEDDDCSNTNTGRTLASVSYANSHLHAAPASSSDDHGPPLAKSFSTEGKPLSGTLPLHTLQRDPNHRELLSGSFFEPVEERKKQPSPKESRNKLKNPVETFALSGPSSEMSKAEKLSSEIEELPQKEGSALHKLMGYSSPSEVIYS